MPKKSFRCSDVADENCSVVIVGNKDAVVELAVLHLVNSHGQKDTHNLRQSLHARLRDEPEVKRASA